MFNRTTTLLTASAVAAIFSANLALAGDASQLPVYERPSAGPVADQPTDNPYELSLSGDGNPFQADPGPVDETWCPGIGSRGARPQRLRGR